MLSLEKINKKLGDHNERMIKQMNDKFNYHVLKSGDYYCKYPSAINLMKAKYHHSLAIRYYNGLNLVGRVEKSMMKKLNYND